MGLVLSIVMAALLTIMAGSVYAADEEEADSSEPAVLDRPIYVPLKPAFVVNYGGQGKLKYLKVEMSVRLKDTEAANAVRHHMPLVRNSLVMLLSKQTDTSIDTQESKELLRQTALADIQALLSEEDGKHGVVDLFFNNFVVQR